MVTDLHAKKSGQYLKAFRKKKSGKLVIAEIDQVQSPKFRQKSVERNETQIHLQVILIDLHAKNQVNIYKHLEKKVRKTV